MNNKISITLRAVPMLGPGNRIDRAKTEYRIEEIRGAVMVFDHASDTHRAGERVSEGVANDFAKDYPVRTLAEKS